MSLSVKRVFVLLFCETTQTYLAIQRADDKTWGLPGGKIENEENPIFAVKRETLEETDVSIPVPNLAYDFEAVPGVRCQLYVAIMPKRVAVSLNSESLDYKWTALDQWPEPAHPQMRRVLDEARNQIMQASRVTTAPGFQKN